jgi:sensor domain CHASE-containing protein
MFITKKALRYVNTSGSLVYALWVDQLTRKGVNPITQELTNSIT